MLFFVMLNFLTELLNIRYGYYFGSARREKPLGDGKGYV
jgi:hypothetical protein